MNDGPSMADKSDRWTVRGIGADTRRKAADMAARADISLGRWLSRLIEQAADKSDTADVPTDVCAAIVARLERLERAVFVADMADVADMKSAVVIALDTADTSDMTDTANTKTTEPLCPTRSPESDTGTPMEAAGVPAGAVEAAGAGAGADDSTDVPGGAGGHNAADKSDTADTESTAALCRTAAGKSDSEMPSCGAIAVRTRLSGDAKTERAADIKRRVAAGESKSDIMSALGISLATLNRALAE